jgi:hypothetical protein
MTLIFSAGFLVVQELSTPALALYRVEALPKPLQDRIWEMHSACLQTGGKTGEPMKAVEVLDLDGDELPDVIFDESRFPCLGIQGLLCPANGCSTYIHLNRGGRWIMAFDILGSYCLDRSQTPPQFITIQKNFLSSGDSYSLNVRYRFEKGMAFQQGRGRC